MGDAHPINAIVRAIDSPDQQGGRDRQRVVVYDLRKKKAIDEPRLKVWRELKYYQVNFNGHAEHTLGPIVVRDNAVGKAASILVTYSVRCEEDRERRLIEAMDGRDRPGAVIDEVVEATMKRAVQERNNVNAPFLASFGTWGNDLEARIAGELRDIGLAAHVRVNLHKRYSDDPIILRKCQIETHPKGYQKDLVVTLSARIEVHETLRTAFLIDEESPQQLEERVIEWTQEFFSLHVTLRDLDRQRGVVEHELGQFLDKQLAERGRCLRQADLAYDIDKPEGQNPFGHTTDCYIEGRQRPVVVQHLVLISLVDLDRLKQSRESNPIAAIKLAIDHATRGAVFKKTYVQLIKDFNQPAARGGAEGNPVVQTIRTEVQKYAETIGYDVEQLVSIPDEKPNKLQRDGVESTLPQEEFGLKDARIKGRVHIKIFAQLPDLELIEAYLQPNIDLEAEIIREAERQVEKKLLETTPHRFHTEFLSGADGRLSVTEELSDAIGNRLREKFYLQNVETSIRMGETALTRRFLNLARGQHEVDVTFLSGTGERGAAAHGEFGAERMAFTIRFTIDGIDGDNPDSWFRFQVRDFPTPEQELEAIRAVLKDELTTMLDQLPVAALRSIEVQRDDTQRRLKEDLAGKIAEDFGISIRVSSVRRRETATDRFHETAAALQRDAALRELRAAAAERGIAADQTLKTYSQLFEQQRELLAKRTEVAKLEPSDPILEDYDQQLRQMEGQLQDIAQSLKPGGSYAARIAAPKEAPKLPPAKTVSVHSHLDRLERRGQHRGTGHTDSNKDYGSGGDGAGQEQDATASTQTRLSDRAS